MTPCFLFGAWTGDTSIICNVLMLPRIAMRPQLYGTVINFLHGCSEKRYGRRDPIMLLITTIVVI